MPSSAYLQTIRERLRDEVGRVAGHAPPRVALVYPSPYRAGMSSLGFLQIHRAIQEAEGLGCERAFLPDEAGTALLPEETPLTYEGRRPLASFPLLAFSVAYELEIAGVVQMLAGAGLPPRRDERDGRHPLVLAGGPLTFSNPLPLAPFVDAIVMGEADALAPLAMRAALDAGDRAAALAALAALPHLFVPAHHGAALPPIARCDDALLPARSSLRTPHAELSGMFLIETERGCSRGCTYCVMRRSTNGGMRLVPRERILELVPAEARRVGLVGAAVSDHPRIAEIVRTLAERGHEVGLSSLRPDRLSDELVGALRLAGHRTLTTAMDGASERLRDGIERRARTRHLVRAAELARGHGMTRLKLYLMLGLPGETDEDVDEGAALVRELSRVVPVALGVAPFCAKRNTPLDGMPFAGIDVVRRRILRLRRGLRGRADVRATSARWAWVEHALAQGGESEGLAVLAALRAGGGFAAWREALRAAARGRRSVGGPRSLTVLPTLPA